MFVKIWLVFIIHFLAAKINTSGGGSYSTTIPGSADSSLNQDRPLSFQNIVERQRKPRRKRPDTSTVGISGAGFALKRPDFAADCRKKGRYVAGDSRIRSKKCFTNEFYAQYCDEREAASGPFHEVWYEDFPCPNQTYCTLYDETREQLLPDSAYTGADTPRISIRCAEITDEDWDFIGRDLQSLFAGTITKAPPGHGRAFIRLDILGAIEKGGSNKRRRDTGWDWGVESLSLGKQYHEVVEGEDADGTRHSLSTVVPFFERPQHPPDLHWFVKFKKPPENNLKLFVAWTFSKI